MTLHFTPHTPSPTLSLQPRRVLLLAVCFLAALSPLSAQRGQIAKLRQESQQLDKQLKETERLIHTTKRDVQTQMSNLQVLNEQISRQQRHIRNIEAERDTLQASLTTMSEQLTALEADLANCQRRHQRAVMYMHRNRSLTSLWSFILTASDFRQMYRRMRYLSEYSKFQRLQAQEIRQKEEAVKKKRQEVAALTAEKAEVLAEQQAQQSQLKEREGRQQQLVAQLGKRQKELESAAAKTRRQRASLDSRIEQLVRQEAEAERRRQIEAEKRRKAELAAAEKKRQAEAARKKREADAAARAKADNKSKKGKDAKAVAKEDRKAKKEKRREEKAVAAAPAKVKEKRSEAPRSHGRGGLSAGLPMPITGSYTITTHFGNYTVSGLNGVTLSNKGIDITGQAGAQARCVAEGEVSYIFSMNGYQNVIVRHGEYLTAYCNLSSVSVRKGQKVSRGQTLGAIGRDAAGNCTLHFQLWRDRTILNPEPWLAK